MRIFLCSWILCYFCSALFGAMPGIMPPRAGRAFFQKRAGNLFVVCSCKKSQLEAKSRSVLAVGRWPS